MGVAGPGLGAGVNFPQPGGPPAGLLCPGLPPPCPGADHEGARAHCSETPGTAFSTVFLPISCGATAAAKEPQGRHTGLGRGLRWTQSSPRKRTLDSRFCSVLTPSPGPLCSPSGNLPFSTLHSEPSTVGNRTAEREAREGARLSSPQPWRLRREDQRPASAI